MGKMVGASFPFVGMTCRSPAEEKRLKVNVVAHIGKLEVQPCPHYLKPRRFFQQNDANVLLNTVIIILCLSSTCSH